MTRPEENGKENGREGPSAAVAVALALETFLPYRLSVLSNTVSHTIADFYEVKFRLTIPQWRVLAVLGRQSGLSAAEVADSTAMDKVAVSRAVAGLIKAGRVRRRFASDDRRRSILELSPKGREIFQAIAPDALFYEKELISTLTPDEHVGLSKILDKLWEQAVKIKKSHIK